ncbi:MAG: hypothetical protein EP343_18765 [Deltaproteobacteria bacterium]|nr:MAG: hypothetical protein EP343_18765 [Deltaproteobacteria bacterium]
MRTLWFAFVLLAFVGIDSASAGVPATPKNNSLRYTPANKTQSRRVAFWRKKKKRKKACYCCKKKFNHNKKFRHCFYDCHCNNGKMTCKMRSYCKLMMDNEYRASKELSKAKANAPKAEKAKKSALFYQKKVTYYKKMWQKSKGSRKTYYKRLYDRYKKTLRARVNTYNKLRRTVQTDIKMAKFYHKRAKYYQQKCGYKTCRRLYCGGKNICQVTQALTFDAVKFEIDMRTIEQTAKRNRFEIDMKTAW